MTLSETTVGASCLSNHFLPLCILPEEKWYRAADFYLHRYDPPHCLSRLIGDHEDFCSIELSIRPVASVDVVAFLEVDLRC